MSKLKLLSLFSGIGAFEKALTNLNIDYELVGFSEIDKYAIESYCAIHNVDKKSNLGDVSKVESKDIPHHDILTHGSPCQSFSRAGKEEGGDFGSGTKSSLMWETVRIIESKRPKYVIWENVKNVLNKKHIHNFNEYINRLGELGYISYYKVLNALDYNVAQNRERIFVVSIHNEHDLKFEFPIKVPLNKCLRDYLDEKVDNKYIVPEQVMIGYRNKKGDFAKRFKIKDLTEYAYCLVAKSGRAVITNNYIYNDWSLYENKPCENNDLPYIVDNKIPVRALTPLEYWRLMGFTDNDFYKAKTALNETFHKGKDKSDAQLYKQAGNSIAVPVLEAIFKNLLKEKIN